MCFACTEALGLISSTRKEGKKIKKKNSLLKNFWRQGLTMLPKMISSSNNPPASAFPVAKTTGVHRHAWLKDSL
jgi:hypothetical protein